MNSGIFDFAGCTIDIGVPSVAVENTKGIIFVTTPCSVGENYILVVQIYNDFRPKIETDCVNSIFTNMDYMAKKQLSEILVAGRNQFILLIRDEYARCRNHHGRHYE